MLKKSTKRYLVLAALLVFLILPNFSLTAEMVCSKEQELCRGKCIPKEGVCLQLQYPTVPVIGNLNEIAAGPIENQLGGLVQYVYYFLLSFAGLAAFVMLVRGGITYLTSESPIKLGDAKEIITGALLGLVIVLSSVLILSTINPQLTLLKPPTYKFGIGAPTIPAVELIHSTSCPREAAACLYDRTVWLPPPTKVIMPGEQFFPPNPPSDRDVLSVLVNPGYAVRFWSDRSNPFSGYNICFKNSYPDLTKCPIPDGADWIDDVYSLEVIPSAECGTETIKEGATYEGTTWQAECDLKELATPEQVEEIAQDLRCEEYYTGTVSCLLDISSAEFRPDEMLSEPCRTNPLNLYRNGEVISDSDTICRNICEKLGGTPVHIGKHREPGYVIWYCFNPTESFDECSIEGISIQASEGCVWKGYQGK